MARYDIQSGLPAYPAGLSDKDAGLVAPLYRAINSVAQQAAVSTGNVIYSSTEQASADQFNKLVSGRFSKIAVRASAALGFGQLVNLHIAGGKVEARVATSAPGTPLPAHAIVDSPSGILAGEWGEVIFMAGRSGGVAGTIFGARYFLGTAGAVQNTAPVAVGSLVQIVGVGLGSAGLYLQIIPG